ncbi:arginine, lysine, histidine permease Can1p [Spathaspora passalidarum NRRL Y-27907]|uniref:Arginine, lysine, histidine permease Can1p n=1 Tax=Spathaspora passalidarum (strain NRRL Y-27907 / 11-Y1) TaxID=619300 RepID=G3ATV2_SPAPN|nr:arginine, lysine, histidine permease Can1p [Spathaspora passalidarum NRRL Y-27907]EGW30328.1 arginine, lysine, histidine permease Can1p [Spathaspora passalidarum NRRL Y-27907]
MVCGAGKTGPVGFRYWRNPGPWGPGILVKGNKNTAQFLGWLSSLINAAFTFQGTELVGVSAGETANPRKSVPSAIRKVLFRILIFYVLCILFLGLLVPYNDDKLEGGGYTKTSPFIIAMNNSGTKILPDIFNAVILTTIISAANSNIYCGSRILYGLAQSGVAPKFFTITNKGGVPYYAVVFTSAFGALGYLAVSDEGNKAFDWLLNISACAGLIAWGWISFTHIRFMNILRSRNISRDSLPFKAKFMPWSAYYATVTIFIITFVQGFSVFWDFNAAGFFTGYVSLILFVALWIFFHVLFNGVGKSSWKWRNVFIPLDECDIDSGVREIEELEYEEEEPKNLWQKFWAAVA